MARAASKKNNKPKPRHGGGAKKKGGLTPATKSSSSSSSFPFSSTHLLNHQSVGTVLAVLASLWVFRTLTDTDLSSGPSNKKQATLIPKVQVVTAKQGGWPTDLVNGPFQVGERISCVTSGCNPKQQQQQQDETGGLFDWHFQQQNIRRCKVVHVDDDSKDDDDDDADYLVDLKCVKNADSSSSSSSDDDTDFSVAFQLSPKCCERFSDKFDVTVYQTTVDSSTESNSSTTGLHFASRYDPAFMIHAMAKLQDEYYPSQLWNSRFLEEYDDGFGNIDEGTDTASAPTTSTTTASTILLHYIYHDPIEHVHHVIPHRVKHSSTYQRIFHTLDRGTTYKIDNKILHAVRMQRYEQHTGTALSCFPRTYLNCQDAVDAIPHDNHDDQKLYFFKLAHSTFGMGIDVVTQKQLIQAHESNSGPVCTTQGQYVIQEAITDLQTISGKRFDIRFYFLLFRGQIYVHESSVMLYQDDRDPYLSTVFDPNDPQSMQQSARRKSTKDKPTVRVYSTEHSKDLWKPWTKAILEGLQEAIPTLDLALKATYDDPYSYHIWGGDAMMTTSGKAIFPEFNDWPNIHYHVGGLKSHKGSILKSSGKKNDILEFGPVLNQDFQNFYYDFIGGIYADLYSIVLGLEFDSNGQGNLCEGRVTRLLRKASPTTITRGLENVGTATNGVVSNDDRVQDISDDSGAPPNMGLDGEQIAGIEVVGILKNAPPMGGDNEL